MIQRNPQNQNVNNNHKVTFECFVSGSNSSLEIIWERNRQKYNSRNVKNTEDDNGITSSLTINNATVSDNGKYRCRATNADGNSTVSTEAKLISKFKTT